jgi:hypothetical protein
MRWILLRIRVFNARLPVVRGGVSTLPSPLPVFRFSADCGVCRRPDDLKGGNHHGNDHRSHPRITA